ncbi:MAG: 1-acyl-sn-glycerol-3-phosphate acyltransferase [Flavobacteriales bacterium]
MNDSFAHMRPYRASEVPDAIEFLLNALDWQAHLSPFLGDEAAQQLIHGLREVDSVEGFQDRCSKVFIDQILERTTDHVTISFSDQFKSHGALFISNHRDIVLDPSLINRALLSKNEPTTQIGIGSNLLELEWVEKLVRLNKSFIVQRGGTPREQLMSSAEVASYVREVILSENGSVWLAQREGRAKDGNDRTSPALVRMLLSDDGNEVWNQLKVQPVSLSYEWDPCDGMKVRELLLREQCDGEYSKESGEDERSMKQGLFGWKGGIHIEFCEPVRWGEPPEGVRPAAHLASLIDQQIFKSMKPWPSQHWAAAEWERLNGGRDESWPDDWSPNPVSSEIVDACEKRISIIIQSMNELNMDELSIRKKWCEITMNPLINRMHAVHAVVDEAS